MADVGAEMPKYRCHKEVWALKIAEVRGADIPKKPTIAELEEILREDTTPVHIEPTGEVYALSGATLVFAEPGYAPLEVDAQYMRKHDPQPGGYYVVYEDGYKSFSPAKAFEDGYTRIQ